MSTHTKFVGVHIDEEMLDRLDRYCRETDRSRSWVVRKAIAHTMNEVEKNDLDLTEVETTA